MHTAHVNVNITINGIKLREFTENISLWTVLHSQGVHLRKMRSHKTQTKYTGFLPIRFLKGIKKKLWWTQSVVVKFLIRELAHKSLITYTDNLLWFTLHHHHPWQNHCYFLPQKLKWTHRTLINSLHFFFVVTCFILNCFWFNPPEITYVAFISNTLITKVWQILIIKLRASFHIHQGSEIGILSRETMVNRGAFSSTLKV